MEAQATKSLLRFFRDIPDPRTGNVSHSLNDVMIIRDHGGAQSGAVTGYIRKLLSNTLIDRFLTARMETLQSNSEISSTNLVWSDDSTRFCVGLLRRGITPYSLSVITNGP